jgi:hypothetical protein
LKLPQKLRRPCSRQYIYIKKEEKKKGKRERKNRGKKKERGKERKYVLYIYIKKMKETRTEFQVGRKWATI